MKGINKVNVEDLFQAYDVVSTYMRIEIGNIGLDCLALYDLLIPPWLD